MADVQKGHYSQAIEDYIIGGEHEHVKKDRKFYISDMGKCMRTRWLKRKGVESTFAHHVYWILQIGNLYHDFAYKALEGAGLLVLSEDYVENDDFVGRFDGVGLKADRVGWQALDIKSAGSYPMKKAMDKIEDEGNVSQVLTYVYFLRNGLMRNKPDDETMKKLAGLDMGSLVYVNKEPSDKLPVITHQNDIPYTKMREEKIKAEIEELVGYWHDDKVPPCTCPSWMKAYNSYLPFCSAPASKVKEWVKRLDEQRLVSTKTELVAIDVNGVEVKLT